MPTKQPAPNPKNKTRIIPTRLPQNLVENIDEIAKAEKMTRAEIIRRAIEAFALNYKTDQLDQRQMQLEKRVIQMESGLHSLMAKSIRVSGQVLYFATLPYLQGLPKQRLNAKGFQALYDQSGNFAAEILKPKGKGKIEQTLLADIFSDTEVGDKSE